MTPAVWLLTQGGLLDPEGEAIPGAPLEGRSIVGGTAAPRGHAVLAERGEIWIHEGERWRHLAAAEIALQCLAWAPGGLLAGTEPARVAWVRDDGLDFLPGFDAVPERPLWNTPFGAPPAVRSLAVATDNTLYADIHVGWIVRSRDGGETWVSLREGLDKDVHQVATHPSDPGTVFAATANGFHLSRDHGDTFTRHVEGLPYFYQRATACFPDAEVYLVSVARHNRGSGARLYRSEDEGGGWERVEGLPNALDRNINTFQLAALENGAAFAVVNDTTLYASEDWGQTWARVGRDLPRVAALLIP